MKQQRVCPMRKQSTRVFNEFIFHDDPVRYEGTRKIAIDRANVVSYSECPADKFCDYHGVEMVTTHGRYRLDTTFLSVRYWMNKAEE